MTAAYDPDELNRSEQSGGDDPNQPKWSGDDANYGTKWGGDYGSDAVNQAEKAAASPAHEDQFPGGYKPGAGEHASSLRSRLFRGRRRKAAIGGAIVALITAAIIAIFIGILPLKILHIVNNLQARFYATAENAVEKETEKLFSGYVLKKMLAGCKGFYIDSNCNPYDGKSLVGRLYRGWHDGRLEDKLLKQTGLELRYNQRAKIYEMRFVRTNDTIDLTDLTKNKTISQIIDARGDWTVVRKNQVRGAFKSALKGTTRHASTMYYLKVTPYLAKKFGIRWCVIGCDKKDDFRDWKNENINDKKYGAKMWLAERVLGPRFELYSMIMQCLYKSDDFCDRKRVIEASERMDYSATAEGCQRGCDGNGRRISPSLREMEEKLLAVAASYGSDHDSLRRAFDRFEKLGFINAVTRSLIEEKVDDVGDTEGKNELENNEEAAKRTDEEGRRQGLSKSAVRTLGWVVTASYIVEFLNDFPETVARLQYEANSATMAQVWAMYRTVVDEGKEGETDAELYGSFVTSLGPGLQPTEGSGGQVGGTAGAEQTPLYNYVINQNAKTAATPPRAANAPPLCSETGNTRYFLDESETTTENYYWGADPGVPSDGGDITVTRPDGTYSVTFYERQGSRGQTKGSTEGFPAQPDYCDPGDGSAFLPSSGFNDYRCKDNRPVPAGRLVCKEMVLNNKSEFLRSLESLKRIPGWGLIYTAADAVTDVVDGLIGTILGWLGKIPFVDRLAGAIASLVTEVAKFTRLDVVLKRFASWMLGINLHLASNNMSGARTGDLKIGGADVTGNHFAHHGIGGVALTPEQLATNLDYYHQQQLTEYRQKSFFAQMLDKESPYSPISKLALALPSNKTAAINSISDTFASIIKNPLGKLISSFASIFTPQTIAASYPLGKSPFGVTQYGIPLDDPVYNQDPDEYWQKYCTDQSPYNLTKEWNDLAARNLNPTTYEPENVQTTAFQSNVPGNKYGTNGCLLIQTTVASAGGTFTDDVLSAEERAEYSSGSDGSTDGPTISGSSMELARQILNNPDIDLSAGNFCRYCLEDIRNTAEGRPAYDNVYLNINLLRFLAELGQSTRVNVNSITGAGSGHSSNSNHYRGTAIDFECDLDGALADSIGRKYGISARVERCDRGVNHWHYSTTGN